MKNLKAGIPSPPLALFVVMLPKVRLTSHSRMSGSRWVVTPSWLSRSLRPFLYNSSVYSCHLFLISSASIRSMTSLVAQTVKRLSTMWETWVRSLGREVPWRRKWQPTPVLLPRKSHGQRSPVSMGSQRVGHDWATSLSFFLLGPYCFCPLLSPSLHEMLP